MSILRASSGVGLRGAVRLWSRRYDVDPWGLLGAGSNTATTYGLSALAQWWMGTPNVAGSPGVVLPPGYVALGTGDVVDDPPNPSDQCLYAEGYGTRIAVSFDDLVTTTTALLAATYSTVQAVGTWTEVGLFDSDVTVTAVGSSGASLGSSVLPLAAGAPAVLGGATPGQYTTANIEDGLSSEYIALLNPAAYGAGSWTLRAPLAFSHAAGIPITVFSGNLWAHAAITPSVTNPGGMQLLAQWLSPFSAVGA